MEKNTARTWDSFKETLNFVMNEFKPSLIFEWGPGESSKEILSYSFVEQLDSFEHDQKYYDRYKAEIVDERFDLMFENEMTAYSDAVFKTYDFMFVDGRVRELCIANSLKRIKPDGLVMVHDAERESYHSAMLLYDYVIFTDHGSTATLTNDFKVYRRALKRLMGI